jgi:hypothetical protein
MPFVTVPRKRATEEIDEVYYPEIKWAIKGADHKEFYLNNCNAGKKGVIKHADLSDIATIIVEQAPRKKVINFRHSFYAGNEYTQYFLAIPWSYYIARVNKSGVILLSAMFFANEELKTTKQKGLCCAPMPNFDFGQDHGLGVCLWKSGRSFGKNMKGAVVRANEYIWTSDFNPGVSYYNEGRPKEIQTGDWQSSLKKWQDLTLAGKTITWVPAGEKCKNPSKEGGMELVPGRDAVTLDDAFEWLCRTGDHNYQ